MATYRTPRIACVAVCAIVGLFSSATDARAQAPGTPSQTATSPTAAVGASPELVNGLAKELGSTPEQAAGVAGLLFTLTKAFTKPEDFAAMSKAVPGMDALLAATPTNMPGVSAAPSPSFLTPGIASSPSQTSGAMSAASNGLSSLGFKPEMILKALSFVWEFLKKYGGTALATVFEGLFKGSAKPAQ
jgi:hypothetical protein